MAKKHLFSFINSDFLLSTALILYIVCLIMCLAGELLHLSWIVIVILMIIASIFLFIGLHMMDEDFITEVRNSELEIKNLSDEAVKALFDFIQDLKNDYNLDFILDLGFLNQKVREFFNYQQILKDYGLGINEIYKNGIVIELHNGNILFIKKYGF